LFATLNEPETISKFMLHFGNDIFTGTGEDRPPRRDNYEDLTWRHPWARNGPLTFGVGLKRDWSRSSEPGDKLRLSVRLQAPRRIKQKSMKAIRDWFHEVSRDLVSIRWTTPVMTLATNPHGDFQPWKARWGSRFEVGAPVNIAGGAVGALTLLLGNGEGYFALTAGHPLCDNLRGKTGDKAFSPPQPHLGPYLGQGIGTITELAVLPPSVLLSTTAKIVTGTDNEFLDFGLIRVSNYFMPQPPRRRHAGEHPFTGDFSAIWESMT
jgi:hypothetical protein